PGVHKEAVSSNAEAVRRAKKSDDAAAIAGENAAHVYGMKVVAGPIEDRNDNTTRFLVIGRASFPPSGNDRTSLMVSIRDQPGATSPGTAPSRGPPMPPCGSTRSSSTSPAMPTNRR